MPFPAHPSKERLWALFIALLLGYYFVISPIHQVWRDHWLVTDRREGTAMITKEHWAGHGVVVYEYRVGGTVYTGQDRRNRRDSRSAYAMPGETSTVYYSTSHPWISSLDPPDHVGIGGLPVVALVWLLEACLLITVLNPESKWALNFSGKHEGPSARASTPRREGLADVLSLVGCAVLIVLGMAAIEIGVDLLFGRR